MKMSNKITIQGKEFEIPQVKGKHLRKISKAGSEDGLKAIEIFLEVDSAFVDEMSIEEITLFNDKLYEVNPSLAKQAEKVEG